MDNRYLYSSEGHTYVLVPWYHRTPGGKLWIEGTQMFTPDGSYIGYWDRSNMPIKLINALRRYVLKNGNASFENWLGTPLSHRKRR